MKHYGRSIQRDTWTAQTKYRFNTVEAKRYRTPRQALIPVSLVDLLVAQHPRYDGGIRQIDLKLAVDSALEMLSVREEQVVRRVLGLDCEAETMAAIARASGLCGDTISKVYQRAIRKLRHPARAKYLRDFMVTA